MNIKKLITLAFFVCASALSAISFDVSIVDKKMEKNWLSNFHLNDEGEVFYVGHETTDYKIWPEEAPDVNWFHYFKTYNKETGKTKIPDLPKYYEIYKIHSVNNKGAFVAEVEVNPHDRFEEILAYYPDIGMINLSELASEVGYLDSCSFQTIINDHGMIVGTVYLEDDWDEEDSPRGVFTYTAEEGFTIIEGITNNDAALLFNNNGQILIYSDSEDRHGDDVRTYSIYDIKTKSYTELKDFGLKKALKSTFKGYDFSDFNVYEHVGIIKMNDNGMILGQIDVGDFENELDYSGELVYFVYSKDFGLKILPISYGDELKSNDFYYWTIEDDESYKVDINNNNQIVITGYRIEDNKFEYTGEFGTYMWDPKTGLKQIIDWKDYLTDRWNEYFKYFEEAEEPKNPSEDILEYFYREFELESVALNDQGDVFLVATLDYDLLHDTTHLYWDSKNGMTNFEDLINWGDFNYDGAGWMELQINSKGQILIEGITTDEDWEKYHKTLFLEESTVLLTPIEE